MLKNKRKKKKIFFINKKMFITSKVSFKDD